MKKSDIASHVASHTLLSRATADAAVNALFTAIADAFTKGETVTITGFGTVAAKTRAAREGRNPRPGERNRHPGIDCTVIQGGIGVARAGQLAVREKAE